MYRLHRSAALLARSFVAAFALAQAIPAIADITTPGATGGILRFPNNNQTEEDNNGFAEAWLKMGVQFQQTGTTRVQVFYLGNLERDTKAFSWNNTTQHGVGLQISTRPTDHLELTFSARYDWSLELDSGRRKQGWRPAINYYYSRHFKQNGTLFVGQPYSANVLRSFGTLEFPNSIDETDDNFVLSIGSEYSAEIQLDEGGNFLLAPLVNLQLGWDSNQNNYNTKIIPAIGVKVRKPLVTGEFFTGIKIEVDYRPVAGTTDIGPIIYSGWYYSW